MSYVLATIFKTPIYTYINMNVIMVCSIFLLIFRLDPQKIMYMKTVSHGPVFKIIIGTNTCEIP